MSIFVGDCRSILSNYSDEWHRRDKRHTNIEIQSSKNSDFIPFDRELPLALVNAQ